MSSRKTLFTIESPPDQVNNLYSTVSTCLVAVSFGAPRQTLTVN